MNSHAKGLRLYLYLYLIALLSTCTMRTLALLLFYDEASYYFTSKTLINISNAVLVASAFLCLTYIFTGTRVRLKASFSTPATYVPTGLIATALLFMLRYLLLPKSSETATALSLFCAVLAVISAIHFFLNSFISEERTPLRSGFAVGTVIFLSAYAALIYFDITLPYNAPAKLADEMAYLFCAIFFLYEARISLGRSLWHLYIAFGLIAGILTAYSAIPSLALYLAEGTVPSLCIEETVLTLSLFIFITFRLLLVLSLRDAGEPKAITAMAGYAENRQRLIDDAERLRPEVYAVQMTIDDLLREEGEDGLHLLGEDAPEGEAGESPAEPESGAEVGEEQTADAGASDEENAISTEDSEGAEDTDSTAESAEVTDNQIGMDIIDLPVDEDAEDGTADTAQQADAEEQTEAEETEATSEVVEE